jgi:hypothetical protein
MASCRASDPCERFTQCHWGVDQSECFPQWLLIGHDPAALRLTEHLTRGTSRNHDGLFLQNLIQEWRDLMHGDFLRDSAACLQQFHDALFRSEYRSNYVHQREDVHSGSRFHAPICQVHVVRETRQSPLVWHVVPTPPQNLPSPIRPLIPIPLRDELAPHGEEILGEFKEVAVGQINPHPKIAPVQRSTTTSEVMRALVANSESTKATYSAGVMQFLASSA